MTLKDYFELDASHQAAFRMGQKFEQRKKGEHLRYLIIEIEGDREEDLEPTYDTFPSSIEIYGDYRIVADIHKGAEQ